MLKQSRLVLGLIACVSFVSISAFVGYKKLYHRTPVLPLMCQGESTHSHGQLMSCLTSMINDGSVDDATDWILNEAGFDRCYDSKHGEDKQTYTIYCQYTECDGKVYLPFEQDFNIASPPTFGIQIHIERGEFKRVGGGWFRKRPRGRC